MSRVPFYYPPRPRVTVTPTNTATATFRVETEAEKYWRLSNSFADQALMYGTWDAPAMQRVAQRYAWVADWYAGKARAAEAAERAAP